MCTVKWINRSEDEACSVPSRETERRKGTAGQGLSSSVPTKFRHGFQVCSIVLQGCFVVGFFMNQSKEQTALK